MATKEIKITTENAQAIEAALRAVNGRAAAFTVVSFAAVAEIVDRADALLDRRDVRIADRAGLVVEFRPAGPSANRYKYSAPSPCVTLRLASDGRTWRLASVAYDTVHPRSAERFVLRMTPAAHARYVEARRDDFGIIPAVTASVAQAA